MMNTTKYIDRLLQGQKVEWKTLGEVGEVRMCKRILKEQTTDDGEVPFYKIGTFGKEPDAYISKALFNEYKSKYNYPKIGEVLISASGTIGRAVIFDGKDAYFQDSNIVWIENDECKVLNKYLFYFYQIAKWEISNGGTIQRLYNDNIKRTKIPIPPLDVQKEIVRILDTFTELTTQLTAELTARKKQYEFYREQLLTVDDKGLMNGHPVEWKRLGEVARKISSGGTPNTANSSYYNGNIPWLRTQEVGYGEIWDTEIKISELGMKNSSAKLIPKNCVIIAMYGATVGRVGINKIPLTTNQACANIQLNEEIAYYRFVYHYLLSQYEYIKSLGAGSQTNINAQIIKKLPIPIPPLEEQERIVSILDKFDTLTNSISEGLPKEIELRKKQYEYYREQLLMFND